MLLQYVGLRTYRYCRDRDRLPHMANGTSFPIKQGRCSIRDSTYEYTSMSSFLLSSKYYYHNLRNRTHYAVPRYDRRKQFYDVIDLQITNRFLASIIFSCHFSRVGTIIINLLIVHKVIIVTILTWRRRWRRGHGRARPPKSVVILVVGSIGVVLYIELILMMLRL